MRRLVIRPGAIGDLIVSLPAMSASPPNRSRSGPPRAPFPSCVLPTVYARIASTGLDLLGVTDPPRRFDPGSCAEFDSIVSWYGANRPEFRDAVADLGLPFTFLAALPAEGTGIHATDFYLEQVRTHRRRAPATASPASTARGTRRLRRHPSVLRQPAQELAARKVSRPGRPARARDAGEMVRRRRRPPASRRRTHRRSL